MPNQSQKKLIFKFILPLGMMEKQSTMTMKKVTEVEDYKSLKLYDFQNLKASIFYQILSSQDLSLLIVKKSLPLPKLTPEQSEHLNERLQNQLIQIQEQYYKSTDEGKLKTFISERSFENDQDREMLIIDACSLIIDFENKYGVKIADYSEALSKIGIEGTFDQIYRQIKQKRMKYKLLKANKEKQGNETAKNDFYDLIGIASHKLGYYIPGDILLIEWCGILNTLKRMTDDRGNKKD